MLNISFAVFFYVLMNFQDIVCYEVGTAIVLLYDHERKKALIARPFFFSDWKEVYLASYVDSIPSTAECESLIERILSSECEILLTMTEIDILEITYIDHNIVCAMGFYLQGGNMFKSRLRWLANCTMCQKQLQVHEIIAKCA